MAVPMPAVVVLFVCKTIIAGPPDANAQFTGVENREWDYSEARMHCRREEVQMFDPAEAQGADPQPFNQQRCQQSAMMLGPSWDAQHKSSDYRFWKFGCPVKIINTITGEIIGWKLPDCSSPDTVICEKDSLI